MYIIYATEAVSAGNWRPVWSFPSRESLPYNLQFFGIVCQHAAPIACHDDEILDANAYLVFQINAGLDGEDHSFAGDHIGIRADIGRFVNAGADAVPPLLIKSRLFSEPAPVYSASRRQDPAGAKSVCWFLLGLLHGNALCLALLEGGVGGLQLGHQVAALLLQVRDAQQHIGHKHHSEDAQQHPDGAA